MKKKISLLICALIFALSLAGCGSSGNKELEYEEATLQQEAEMIIGSFSQMADADFERFTEGSELEVNLTLMQSGLSAERGAFISMIESWQAAVKECGSYVSHGDYALEASEKEIVLSTSAEFEKRDADITFVFDKKLNIESMTVDAHYTTGDILKKAGLNTLLGMGTVFVVLIFISFIISLFKYIPAIEEKFRKKAAPAPVTAAVPASEPVVEVVEHAEDDLELAAVITAAIAAAEGTASDGFVVRSIKRRKTNKWS